MKNILVFSPIFTHPQISGNSKYIYEICKELKEQGNKIHFVYYSLFKYEFYGILDYQKYFNEMQLEWDSLITISCSVNSENKPKNKKYFEIDEWIDTEDLENIFIDALFKTNNLYQIYYPDVIIANYVFISKIFDFYKKEKNYNPLKIIITNDKLSDRHITQKNFGIEPDFFYTSKKEEEKGLNRADTIIAIQSEEKKYFQSILPGKKVVQVSYFEKEKFLNKKYDLLKNIGFIGTQSSMNIEAIKFFLKEYGDMLLKYDIILNIAGSVCNIKELFNDLINKNVFFLGNIDNIDNFYKSMDLIIIPIVIGDGQNIKTIEALSYGVPIWGTKLAFREIDYNELFICDFDVKSIEKNLNDNSNYYKTKFKQYILDNKNNLREAVKL